METAVIDSTPQKWLLRGLTELLFTLFGQSRCTDNDRESHKTTRSQNEFL